MISDFLLSVACLANSVSIILLVVYYRRVVRRLNSELEDYERDRIDYFK